MSGAAAKTRISPGRLVAASLAILFPMLSPALGSVNLVPNPYFQGDAGTYLGVTGTVPDQWRGFAVGGGAAEISVIPLPADALYPGSPITNAVKLKVNAFGADQGFDNAIAWFKVSPSSWYNIDFYVKSGDPAGTWNNFTWGFPLFDASKNYLYREPGGCPGGSTWVDSVWWHVTGPSFNDAQAAYAHISFRVINNTFYQGEKSIIIAMPNVAGPLDPFIPPTPAELAERQTWTANDKLIGTSYFYWYRWPDRHFFTDPASRTTDVQTDHFPAPQNVSMDFRSWHKQQASDMIDAGIDMLWPVYWAAPGIFDNPGFSFFWTALGPLQDALDELTAEGKTPPKIGMFYDTSTLGNAVRGVSPPDGVADLTTQAGKDLFYGTIRSFFCNVKPKHWACINGRPIVVLYSAIAPYDQSTFDYVGTQFAAEFGGITPYIIREQSWNNVTTDSSYRWGAALRGPYINGIAALGPGYNDTGAPGRTTPIRLREDGNYYRWSWLQVLQSPVKIVHLETWSEMHEGTDICESAEYGRQYIDLTAHYAAYFKSGTVPNETVTLVYPDPVPRPPNMQDGAEYADARYVEIYTSSGQKVNAGIDDHANGDGALTLVSHAGETYLSTDAGYTLRYGYFGLKDPFYFDQHRRAQVTLDYLDEGAATVQLQYDSYDSTAPLEGSYASAAAFTLTNSGTVKTWTGVLENARFANRQNAASDFRFAVTNGPLYIKRVRVDVLNLPEPILRVTGLAPAVGATVPAPVAITATFATNVLASSVNVVNFQLVRSGGDGVFGNGNDAVIAPAGYSVNGNQAAMNLTGVALPPDVYQVTLVGRGQHPLMDVYNKPLDGKFTGTLPSGDGTGGGNFVATFTLTTRGDFDGDGDVDQADFGWFQACLSGPLVHLAPGCESADYTGDDRVDDADFAAFLACLSGPTLPPGCN